VVASFRFLLDQNFPSAVFGLEELDESVEFVHLARFAPELAKESTPDWMICLAAAQAGFDGVVTRDLDQIRDSDTLIALAATNLCVITWATPIEDPVTEWAQLVAYLPEIKKRLAEDSSRILLLPAPRLLRTDQFRVARSMLQEYASLGKTSVSELRAEALPRMRNQLRNRHRDDLLRLLQRRRKDRG
jgi:hypothetical protein